MIFKGISRHYKLTVFVTRTGVKNRLVIVNRDDAKQELVHFFRLLNIFLGNHGQR